MLPLGTSIVTDSRTVWKNSRSKVDVYTWWIQLNHSWCFNSCYRRRHVKVKSGNQQALWTTLQRVQYNEWFKNECCKKDHGGEM